MANTKPSDVAVLNVIQAAAADVVLSGGKLQINNGTFDLLSEALKISDGTNVTKTAYNVGVARVTEIDLAGVSLLANHTYRIAVEFPKRLGFNNEQVIDNGGRQEANQLMVIREYVVSTGANTPSADDLRDLFIDRITQDTSALVTAASGGAGIVELRGNDAADGTFSVEAPAGAVETETTPYVAPSGTPAIVEVFAQGQSSASAEYTTWAIAVNRLRRNNAVSGGKVHYPEFIYIFADELAANFAAMETELDAVLGGTHTPEADYLGI
jgi:hypothetical protein